MEKGFVQGKQGGDKLSAQLEQRGARASRDGAFLDYLKTEAR